MAPYWPFFEDISWISLQMSDIFPMGQCLPCAFSFAASTDHETMNESIEGAGAKSWEKRNRHDVLCKPTRGCLLV